MAQFEAEVRLQDLAEVDALTARRTVEDRLRNAGFQNWKIVRIGPQKSARQGRAKALGRPAGKGLSNPRADAGQGIWVVIAALAWAIWFVWLLGG